MQTLRPAQLAELLAACIPAREPILIGGDPGIGKTRIVEQVAQQLGYDCLLAHPSCWDSVESGGFPAVALDRARINKLPVGRIADALACTRPTVFFLDDLAHAPSATMPGLMQFIWARELDGQRLPDCVSVVAATNERTKHTGTGVIIEPLKARFCTVKLEPNHDDWNAWAIAAGIDHRIVAFLAFRPSLLHAWTPSADLANSPSPRAWEAVSRKLALGLSSHVQHVAVAGHVGEGAAGEFSAFCRVYRDLIPPSQVFLHPETAPLLREPSAAWALMSALVCAVKADTVEALVTYLERTYKAGLAEYVALAVKLLSARVELRTHVVWNRISGGDIGEFLVKL